MVVLHVDRQAQRGKPVQHGAMRFLWQLRGFGRTRRGLGEQAALRPRQAVHLTPAISEKTQGPLGGDARIQLAQAACRRIARVDEHLFVALGLGLVQFFEVGAVHQHLAAHLQHLRRGSLELQRNRLDGTDVRGDVFARLAIAARGGLHQAAVLVAQADRQTVELEFAEVIRLLRRAEQACAAQGIGHAAVERHHILLVEGVAQGEHGYRVAHRAEGGHGRRPDPLGGRFRRYEFRVFGLQGLQLPHQPVILGIRNGGVVVDVVADVVLFDFSAQARRGLRRAFTAGSPFHIRRTPAGRVRCRRAGPPAPAGRTVPAAVRR
ncbi:hypothetical protein FQZ97_604390 [compost metagenome]